MIKSCDSAVLIKVCNFINFATTFRLSAVITFRHFTMAYGNVALIQSSQLLIIRVPQFHANSLTDFI